jgi:hypothetical protein
MFVDIALASLFGVVLVYAFVFVKNITKYEE